MITQQELKTSYRYNPKDSSFRKITKSSNWQAKKPMGRVGPSGLIVVSVFGYWVYAERLAAFYTSGKFPAEPIRKPAQSVLEDTLLENEKMFGEKEPVAIDNNVKDFTFAGDREAAVYKSDSGYVVQALHEGKIYKVKTYARLDDAMAHMLRIKRATGA